MLLKRIFGSEREKERWMSGSLENRSKVFKIYSVIRTKIPQSILLAVGLPGGGLPYETDGDARRLA